MAVQQLVSVDYSAVLPAVPVSIAKVAVQQLANVDYSVATRISHGVARIVPWALDHHYYWIADFCMMALQYLDSAGNELIAGVSWLVLHCH